MQETKVLRVTKESHKQVSDLAKKENILKIEAATRLIERTPPINSDRLYELIITGFKKEGEAREEVYKATEANYSRILDLSKILAALMGEFTIEAAATSKQRAAVVEILVSLMPILEKLNTQVEELEGLTRAIAEFIIPEQKKKLEIVEG